MNTIARALAEARRFVDAATAVCEAARRLGVPATRIALNAECVEPVLAIDDAEHDPLGFSLAIPLLGSDGAFGAIEHRHHAPFTQPLERELAALATLLAVWCAKRGLDTLPELSARDRLGPRQRQIAELVALGQTNDEIAATLAISVNTVKGRLKEVFERLDVRNRTELAHVMLRVKP